MDNRFVPQNVSSRKTKIPINPKANRRPVKMERICPNNSTAYKTQSYADHMTLESLQYDTPSGRGNRPPAASPMVSKTNPSNATREATTSNRSTGGSNDSTSFWRPAKIFEDPAANEIYIADGYGNRRVVVLDRDTGRFKRHWGAYGKRPDDAPVPAYTPSASPSPPQAASNDSATAALTPMMRRRRKASLRLIWP